jgi:hypothetical protein
VSRVHAAADQTMRALAKIVTDRRWAATATAMALGFGLFIGVAIGPGAAGTLATGGPQIVEVPGSSGGTEEEATGGGGETTAAPAPSPGGEEAAEEAPETLASIAPFEPALVEPAPEEPAPTPEHSTPQPEEPAEEEEPEAEGQTLDGTVVHANPAAASYALAIKGGELVAVHSAKLPAAGTKLSLPVRQLANGTFAEEEKPKREGRPTSASFTGTVTFTEPDPAAPSYTVSGRGASVLVRVEPDPSGAAPQLPPLGSFATVDARIGKPPAEPDPALAAPPAPACDLGPGVTAGRGPKPPASALWQQKLKVEDVPPSTYLEVAGLVAGLCVDRPGLLLSADDAADGGDDLLLALSPKVDAKKLEVADSILATIEVAADGTLTLTGLASDERAKGADDARTAQGDLAR